MIVKAFFCCSATAPMFSGFGEYEIKQVDGGCPCTRFQIKRRMCPLTPMNSLEIARSRTSLIIAHRLSTVVEAGEILVMEAGRIVERGCAVAGGRSVGQRFNI